MLTVAETARAEKSSASAQDRLPEVDDQAIGRIEWQQPQPACRHHALGLHVDTWCGKHPQLHQEGHDKAEIAVGHRQPHSSVPTPSAATTNSTSNSGTHRKPQPGQTPQNGISTSSIAKPMAKSTRPAPTAPNGIISRGK